MWEFAERFDFFDHEAHVGRAIFLPKINELHREVLLPQRVVHQVNCAKAARAQLLLKLKCVESELVIIVVAKGVEKLLDTF